VLSRLVIDLDAADSKFVRTFEELEHGQKEDDAVQVQHTRPKIASSMNDQPPPALDELRISPHDVLSYAFVGDIPPGATRYEELRTVLERNHVYPMDSLRIKTGQISSRFAAEPFFSLRSAGFVRSHKMEIYSQIRDCNSLWRLRRMLSILSSTLDGCNFILEYEAGILNSFSRCLDEQNLNGSLPRNSRINPKIYMLQLINNLQTTLKQKELSLGPILCSRGYNTAVMLKNIASMNVYSKELLSMKDFLMCHAMSMRRVLRYHRIEDMAIVHHIRQIVFGSSLDLKNNVTDSNNRFSVSIVPENNWTRYTIFLSVLASLGMKEELWKEWIAPNRILPSTLNEDAHQKYQWCRAQMFAAAFLWAKDPSRALNVLESFQHNGTQSTVREEPSQHSQTNTVSISPDFQLAPSNQNYFNDILKCRYQFLRFSGTADTSWDFDNISHLLRMSSSDPAQTLTAIKQLLLLDVGDISGLRHTMWQRGPTVTWGKYDGKEGLAVVDHNKTILWRPLTV
jgi:hypothetical protein